MYVGLAGNIGSGKKELTKLLEEEFGWQTTSEYTEDNPYLASFYSDMSRWALNLQIYFLSKRFKSVQRAMWNEGMTVQDRTLYEDANVFVENLRFMGLISSTDYATYRELYDVMISFVKPPTLLIYLEASPATLINNIRRSSLVYESSISYEYVTMLNHRYQEWIETYHDNKVTIHVDNLDIVRNEEARHKVISLIKSNLPESALKKIQNP